jgi:cytochrome P450
MSPLSLLHFKKSLSPQAFSNFLIEQGPVFWWEPDQMWVVTDYDMAKHCLTSQDLTANRAPFFMLGLAKIDLSLMQDFLEIVPQMMVMNDPPEHTARRRICYHGFSNQTLQNLAPLITQTVRSQLEKYKPQGEIEFVEDLAKILPSTVLAHLFNIPEADRPLFYTWTDHMTQFFGSSGEQPLEKVIQTNQSAKELRVYFRDLAKQRRLNPQHDFLSVVLQHQTAFALTEDEIIAQAILMLAAGQITVTDQLCNNLHTLLAQAQAQADIQSGAIEIETALEELTRLDPAVSFIFRLAKHDTVLGKQPIKAGQAIFISTHAVNRNEHIFTQPHECDFSRPPNKTMSYGFGPHYCLGAKLAQLEMSICFQELFTTFKGLRLHPSDLPKRKYESLAFSGFERMMLTFTRR